MVGRVTPTILAMDAFETCFCRRTRISSSLPSSRDFPSTPFGRPSSRPLARQASKERLLELMKDAPDIEALRKMEQMDLAIEYAERCVAVVPGLAQHTIAK